MLAFAVPPNSEKVLVPTYTDRLMRNFANRRGLSQPISPPRPNRSRSFSGADDELMLADKYAEAVHAVAPSVDVKLIDGVNHMGIVSAPRGGFRHRRRRRQAGREFMKPDFQLPAGFRQREVTS